MIAVMKPVRYFAGLAAIMALFTVAAAAQAVLSSSDKMVVSDFEKRVKKYSKVREKAIKTVPKISDDATPEQIIVYKTALKTAVQNARAGAKAGDIFTPAAQDLIKRLIKAEFQGWERNELRKKVLEADTKGVPLAVNTPYPEQKELVDMPPPLLLTLPQLPKNLRYRFIGRSLAVLDRDNALIVDFMREALP